MLKSNPVGAIISLIVVTKVSIAALTFAHWPTVLIPFVVALTNVWAYWSDAEDTPTLNVIVVAVFARIGKLAPDAGSVDLGYEWFEPLPSCVQVNVRELSAILINSPTLSVWDPIVATIRPVAGSYVAPVAVNCWTASSVIPQSPTIKLSVLSAVRSPVIACFA